MARVETFLFPKRVHRISFLARFLACLIATQLLYAYMPLLASAPLSAPRVIAWWIAAIFLAVYSLFFVFLPRLRDARMSEWWLVLALLPFINLLLGVVLLFRAPAATSGTTDDADFFWT
jgi:uncharacterized membrane protein YhaH (DUF805 family)